jgi:hypothetical protein
VITATTVVGGVDTGAVVGDTAVVAGGVVVVASTGASGVGESGVGE